MHQSHMPILAAAEPRPEHLAAARMAAPMREQSAGLIACPFCGNRRFRRSRFRSEDLLHLAVLRYPLRCTRCNQRQYGTFAAAGLAEPRRNMRREAVRSRNTWKDWTGGETASSSGRPLPANWPVSHPASTNDERSPSQAASEYEVSLNGDH